MGYDIYGNVLEPGFCEVHPHVREPYPCQLCFSEREAHERREAERAEWDAAMREQADAYYAKQWADACAPWFEVSTSCRRVKEGIVEKATERQTVHISVDRRDFDGSLQLSINVRDESGAGHGYRIAGPKYDGFGKTTLLKRVLDERDVREIESYLAIWHESRATLAQETDG